MSGFFSTYLTQNNASRLRVRFLDAGSNELGRGEVGGADFVNSLPIQDGRRDWGQDAATGLLPIGTSSLAVEVVSDTGETNYDGYTDLVDFRIVSAAESLLFVEVNTSTGNVVLKNQTGDVIHIDYYEIVSSGGNASVLPIGTASRIKIVLDSRRAMAAATGGKKLAAVMRASSASRTCWATAASITRRPSVWGISSIPVFKRAI